MTAPVDITSTIAEKLDGVKDVLAKLQAKGGANDARQSLPLPNVREGEDSLSSRGYSYMKLFQLLAKQVSPNEAKLEVDLHNRFQKLYSEHGGYTRTEPGSVLAPMGAELMPMANKSDRDFAYEVGQVVKAGALGADPREVAAIRKRWGVEKTLSWQDETALGALVAPPMFGELIDVLRNNEVFLQAGARMIGMPPNGRMVWPRQTGASTAYYVGESAAITASEPTTGDVTLQAKKVAALVKIPNELFRYSSISVESFVRDDMMKVMALRMDKELLEGVGSSVAPKGLINYAGITAHTPLGSAADAHSGFALQPEDIMKMIAEVEEKNATFVSWVSRPLLWAYLANRRADAITAGDNKGPFVFNLIRELGDDMNVRRTAPSKLNGYPFYKSTQVSGVRTRGSATTNNTYLLGGDFSDYMIAISPTVEFATTQQGDTAFQQDQTWLRAILPHDGAPRREASFVLLDNLLYA